MFIHLPPSLSCAQRAHVLKGECPYSARQREGYRGEQGGHRQGGIPDEIGSCLVRKVIMAGMLLNICDQPARAQSAHETLSTTLEAVLYNSLLFLSGLL